MKKDGLIIISVDDHIVDPPELFEQHVPAALRDQAPKYVILEKGAE